MDARDSKLYSDFVNRMIGDKDTSIEAVDRLLAMNIDHVRSFTATLLTLNITVVGAVIAAYITNSANIPYSLLVIIGIIILFINEVCVLFYSAVVLVNENKNLTGRRKFLKTTFDTTIDLAKESIDADKTFEMFDQEVYLPKLKEFAESENLDVRRIDKESWSTSYLYLFCGLFIVGLVCIVAGIYPWAALISQ
jgi:hypothetical protein